MYFIFTLRQDMVNPEQIQKEHFEETEKISDDLNEESIEKDVRRQRNF